MQMTASTDPAELLLSAEEMLQLSPEKESSRALRVEVSISLTTPELLRHKANCTSLGCLQVAQPNNILAFVQALIYCQRYEDAACRCDELMPGVDRLYLQAQAAWRAGDLAPALEFLDAAVAISPESQKCRELHKIVSCLVSRWAAAHDAFDDGELRVCVFASNGTDLLKGTSPLPADYPLIEGIIGIVPRH